MAVSGEPVDCDGLQPACGIQYCFRQPDCEDERPHDSNIEPVHHHAGNRDELPHNDSNRELHLHSSDPAVHTDDPGNRGDGSGEDREAARSCPEPAAGHRRRRVSLRPRRVRLRPRSVSVRSLCAGSDHEGSRLGEGSDGEEVRAAGGCPHDDYGSDDDESVKDAPEAFYTLMHLFATDLFSIACAGIDRCTEVDSGKGRSYGRPYVDSDAADDGGPCGVRRDVHAAVGHVP